MSRHSPIIETLVAQALSLRMGGTLLHRCHNLRVAELRIAIWRKNNIIIKDNLLIIWLSQSAAQLLLRRAQTRHGTVWTE